MNSRRKPRLTHLDKRGAARMVDVGGKAVTRREAVATARVQVGPSVFRLLSDGALPKGDALAVARVAGIQGAKQTSQLIPLCHPLPIEAVDVDLRLEAPGDVLITAVVRISGRTGVEMEALTAVSVAALALYDMCKSVTRDIVIGPIQLESKSGGKSGDWRTATPTTSPVSVKAGRPKLSEKSSAI